MKEQMTPAPTLIHSLKYELSRKKRTFSPVTAFGWGSAAICTISAIILVFNLAMPTFAEDIPVIGEALSTLNEIGSDARAEGKTPDFLIKETKEASEDFSLTLSGGECNGLDLIFRMEVKDLSEKIAPEAEYISVTDAILEIGGMYIHPTDENPRLKKSDDGSFCGWATFNSSPLAAAFKDGDTLSAVLYCSGLTAYVEGATHEEVTSKYTYPFEKAAELSVKTDISDLSVKYLGTERYGITVEHILTAGDRTDIVFTVDETVEYPSHFSIYTKDLGEPRLISVNSAADGSGDCIYSAVFETEETDGNVFCETVENILNKEESIYVDGSYPEGIVFYSHATGEYYNLTDKEAEE